MKLGFIGLGNMGHGMVVHLLKDKHEVHVFDIDQSKIESLKKPGAKPRQSVSDLVSNVTTVILCLPHPKISEDVIFGEEGIVSTPGNKVRTVIETSTLTPDQVVNFEKKLTKQKIGFLSAPMFGGQSSADVGKIWFVVEGNKALLKEHQDLFSAMGRKTSYLGEIPQATIAKLARNMCRFANVANALEVIDFLHQTTKDIEPIYDLLVEDSKTNFDRVWESAMTDYALKKKPYTASKISVKDLTLALKIAKENNIDMPIAKVTKKVHKDHEQSN